MLKIFFTSLLIFLQVNLLQAQSNFFTKSAIISFHSSAVLEDIDAVNSKGLCIFIPSNGQIEFSVLMKGFEFEKALMQEHFNEDYVESSKYPKAIFKGVVENSSQLLSDTDNTYSLKVSGALTLHGVSKNLSAVATFKVNKAVISGTTNFIILLSDYGIRIPAVVANNINKQVSVSVRIPAFRVM